MRPERRDDPPAPLSPRFDPFYIAPDGWQNAKPGDILASREIKPSFTSSVKMNVEKAYQLVYRSSGTDDSIPMYTLTTVLVPQNARKDKLVMMMPYMDSNFVDCAPSYKIQAGAPPELNPVQSIEELLWTGILNDGWTLTIPDHEGPQAAFASGILEGHASLDALRATLQFKDLGLSPDSSIVGAGYSGGAIAGGWAAALQPSYASELNIAGWALGGTPSNLTAVSYGMDKTPFSGLSAAGIAGVVDSYHEAEQYITSVITDQGNQALQYTREHCMDDILLNLQNVDIFGHSFTSNTNQLLSADAISGLLHTLTLGSDPKYTPKTPVYMYHALHDEVIAYQMANDTANNWCKNGAQVQFETYTGLEMGHVSTEVLNTPLVLKYIRDRMSGQPLDAGCTWNSAVNPLWDPSILGARLTEVLNAVGNLFGTRVGRGDAILKENLRKGKL